jgi:hypothetical protein
MKRAAAMLVPMVIVPLAAQDAPGCNRSIIQYRSASSVVARGSHFPMTGFRMFGNYLKGSGPDLAPADPSGTAAYPKDFGGGLQAVTFENWYAVFACANAGDKTCVFKIMPFIRVMSVAGPDGVNFNMAGESVTGAEPQSYKWDRNSLVGADCLVISETVNGRANAFSGRVTRIVANSSGGLNLASRGSIGAMDYLLPAPPGYSHYRYLGTFYVDNKEVRNIQDSGSLVKARMVNLSKAADTNGDKSNGVQVPVWGYISPLATAIVIQSRATIGSAGAGSVAEYFDADSSRHTLEQRYYEKPAGKGETYVFDAMTLPFSFGQSFYYRTGGSLQGNRAASSLQVTGWVEP